jgi:O-antigen ligase
MNAHNQYFEETLHNGIGGLLLFLISLLVPAYIALSRKDLIYLAFILIFSLCCITESMLTRQIGIIFYAFFNSLYFFNGRTPVARNDNMVKTITNE